VWEKSCGGLPASFERAVSFPVGAALCRAKYQQLLPSPARFPERPVNWAVATGRVWPPPPLVRAANPSLRGIGGPAILGTVSSRWRVPAPWPAPSRLA
jgi:hypothetical protein